jgi:hypothetical protein
MPDLVSQLAAIENTLKNLATEWVVVLDDDGSVLFSAQGDTVSVRLPKHEAAKFIGKTVTHYHPVVTSFSESDIALAASYQLREIRAVDNEYLYRMCPPIEGWSESQWRQKLQAIFEKIEAEQFGLFFDRLNAGRILQREFNRELYHAIWLRFAKETGAFYERHAR